MQKILLDTNFIVTCTKQKIDLFEELKGLFGFYELIVPEQVIEELKKLAKSKKLKVKEREAAEVSLELIEQSEAKIIELENKGKSVDNKIAEYLNENTMILATLDKHLRRMIENKKVKFLTIKKKKKVVVV